MDLIDFKELIDLGANLSIVNTEYTDKQNDNISQRSLQEPLAAVLDEMCAAVGDHNSVVDDPLEPDIHEAEVDTIVNFKGSEEKMSETTFEENLKIDHHTSKDDTAKIEVDAAVNFSYPVKTCTAMVDSNLALEDLRKCDTQYKLNEFEHILAATYLSNSCTDVNETNGITDHNNITNTTLNGIIKPLVPYNLPIKFEKTDETGTKCASIDKDTKPGSFLNSADDFEALASGITANNEVDYEYNAGTAELKYIDTSFNEDIFNIDEFINDCCFLPEEKFPIVGITTIMAGSNEPVDSDNVNDIVKTNSDSDDGYNSSDFEFITEDEAKKGIIPGFKSKIIIKKTSSVQNSNTAPYDTNIPSTSNPYKNEASPSEYIKYSKHRFQCCYAELSSEFHVVPEGEQYLDMFRGQFAPVIVNNLHGLGNKSVLPTTPMGAMFEDLGFNIPENLEDENIEYKGEADECAKKIRSTYPGENRKRRRRF